MSAGCAFCDILAGRSPASVVYADAHVVAFMDLRQAVPGHVLVVPRVHAVTLDRLDEDTAAQLMRIAHRVAIAMRSAWRPDGFNLWQSNGDAGGQDVPHVHLHVHPRRTGDGLPQVYPVCPRPSERDELDRLAADLRTALAAHGSP